MTKEFLEAKLAKVVHAVQELRNVVNEDEESSVNVDNALTVVEDILAEEQGADAA
jgi:hypothetical protein